MKTLLAICLLSIGMASAQVASPPISKIKITGFIYEKGCIHGEFDLYLFLEGGKIVHVDESNTPGKEVLQKALEGIEGINRIFACGITA